MLLGRQEEIIVCYEKGLIWFEEKIGKVKTEEQRKKILGYIKYYYSERKDWTKAWRNCI